MQTIGIYSYPRSGARLLRSIIFALANADKPLREEDVEASIPSHPSKAPDSGSDYDTIDGTFRIFKSHSVTIAEEHNGEQIDTRHYFYILRHPLDVFCSYIDFLHENREKLQWNFELPLLSFEQHLASGTLDDFFGAFMLLGNVFPGEQGPGSWWESLPYWRSVAAEYPDYVTILRYEDIVVEPIGSLTPIAGFFMKTSADLKAALDKNWSAETGSSLCQAQDIFKYKRRLPDYLIKLFANSHAHRLNQYGYLV